MSEHASATIAFLEDTLETGIIAIKGFIPMLWLQSKTSPIQFLVGGIAVLLATFLLTLSPSHDPAEPPLIKPRIPVIGHLIGLIIDQVNYLTVLFDKTGAPIATIPIGHRKLYVIFDATLQQAALKAKDMDAQSFMVDFVPRVFGVKQGTVDRLLGRDGVHPNIMADMEQVFKAALSGDNMNRLATTTLAGISDTLNSIDPKEGLEVPNLFIWLQNLLTSCTARALWGAGHNPYKDEKIIDAQWDFEANMSPLVLGILPSIIARKAYQARNRIQKALEPYYRARHDQKDPTVSEFVRARSRLLRKYDLPDDELAKNEVAVTLVATTNALSTLFWCIAEIWVRPELLAEIRTEASKAVFPASNGKVNAAGLKEVTINATGLEAKCPLLASCFRESIRLASQIVTARRVLKDTTISDGVRGGRTYLLKAETNVMMPARVVHRNKVTWGEDAEKFNPRRFLSTSGSADQERARKAAFVPFGGGKHMCPGRHFAFTENLAMIVALAIGFDIVGLDANKLKMGDSKRGETAKPLPGLEGGPVRLTRREGWEGVTWKFTC